MRVKDAERDNDRPRPTRHSIDVDIGPLGQQHHLGRHGWTIGVRELPEQREIEFGEAVALRRTTQRSDDAASTEHVRAVRIVPGQLQGKVGFDGDTQVGRAAGVVVPSPFGQLLSENITGRFDNLFLAFAAKKGQQQDVLRLKDSIPLELTYPMAVRGLSFQQAMARAFHCRGKWRTMVDVVPEAVGE